MTNDMVKCGLILTMWLYIVGVFWVVAVPDSSSALGLEVFNGLEGIQVIKYDGPRYEMSEEEMARRRHAHSIGGPWERPANMPVIELKEGTILDFGDDNNGTVTTMSGWRLISAYAGYSCIGNSLTSIFNFGCGTGCINLMTSALSGRVQQQTHKNPYPTMDVWSGQGCSGSRLQHFGVEVTDSCTNVNNGPYQSFIGYYNC